METTLSASELLGQLHRIEAGFGRVRSVRNAARVLDIDILFYGDQIINSESLQIPHPRLHTRAFVLCPLCEIASDFIHPVLGATSTRLYDTFLQTPEGGQACLPLNVG